MTRPWVIIAAGTLIVAMGSFLGRHHTTLSYPLSSIVAALCLAILVGSLSSRPQTQTNHSRGGNRSPVPPNDPSSARDSDLTDGDRPSITGSTKVLDRGELTFRGRSGPTLTFRFDRLGQTFTVVAREELGSPSRTPQRKRWRSYHVENAGLVDDNSGQALELDEALMVLEDLRPLLLSLVTIEPQRFFTPTVWIKGLPDVQPFWATLRYSKNRQNVVNRAGAGWRTLHPQLGLTPPLWDGYAPRPSAHRSLCRSSL